MRRSNIEGYCVYIGLGAFLGYFGSCILYLSWLIAPVLGFLMRTVLDEIFSGKSRWRYYPTFSPYGLIALLGIGIFLGGFPMWLITAFMFKNVLWIVFQMVATAALFIVGGLAKDVYRSLICRRLIAL